ncbi:hypothetical protein Tco_0355361, partial [Tanacetum coccineum]
MGKNKLESASSREYDDEFLKAFKEQFHNKKFMGDHIKTSKTTWDDRTLENWNYGPNTVLMLIYLHYTKIDGMVMMQRKWLALRNWTSQDAMDRENFKMSKGRIGLVEVIEDDDKEDENEKDAEKRKLRELEHLLKEYMEMAELFSGDEKLTLYVKKFKEEFTKGFRKYEERSGTSGVGNGDGNEDGGDNNEVDVAEDNEATETGIDVEISVKICRRNRASKMRQAAEKEAAEKEAAKKEAAAKEKEEAEKIAAAKKKEQVEKLAAAKKKEKAKKLAAAKKEQAEKLAAA